MLTLHARPFTEPVGLQHVRFGHQRAVLPSCQTCCRNFPEGMFFEKQEERRLLIPTRCRRSASVPDPPMFCCLTTKTRFFFFNCENKSQFTWNSFDRSFWTQTSPAPHPHYSRCSPLKMSKLADNFKKRRHISRYVFFFFSLGPLSASGRFHILHRKACSDAAAWPFLLLLGESRSLIVSQGL